MQEMKFKWKLIAIFGIMAICAMWYAKEQYRSNSMPPISLDEVLLLKEQLKLFTQCKKCDNVCTDTDLPVIYAITPTFTRPVQKAELTRLSHTFRLVPNFHWIVVEDSGKATDLVENVLKKSTLNYTHLAAVTPTRWKLKQNDPNWKKPRGVSQRNAGLDWLRNNLTPQHKGVIYFADDDNTYSLRVFEEMRHTRRVSVWPVGLVGGLMVEKCLINTTTGHIIGWNSAWHPERPFPLDMAGFAINLQLFLSKPEAKFSFVVDRGYQESAILRHLVASKEDLEPKGDNCTKVYVWHTRTEAPKLIDEIKLLKAGKEKTNKDIEV